MNETNRSYLVHQSNGPLANSCAFNKKMLGFAAKAVCQTTGILRRKTAINLIAVVTSNQQNFSTLGEFYQYYRYKYFPQPREHLDEDKWAKIFCVEGNIGSGKTKLAEELAKKLDLRYFPQVTVNYDLERFPDLPKERIDWYLNPKSVVQLSRGLSIDKMCKEPNDWVDTGRLQYHMLALRYLQYNDAMSHLLGEGDGVVMVRHFYSDVVFAHALRKMGWISKEVYDVYDIFQFKADDAMIAPQVVLYLDIPAELCYERVQAGDNEAEKHLPIAYFKAIEDAYKNKYIPSARARGVTVVEIEEENANDVDLVIENLDDMPTMLAPNNLWGCTNKVLCQYLKDSRDGILHHKQIQMYIPFDEMWRPRWYGDAMNNELGYMTWRYQKGYNKDLGDKWIWLKS